MGVGLGHVVQVVDGAQQGVRIDFRDPAIAGFDEENGIAADLNGVAVTAVHDQLWITWPDSADSRTLILRTFTSGTSPSRPAQQTLASVREERIVFSTSAASILGGATTDLVPFRAVDTFVSPAHEKIHRRRFSRFQLWAEISVPTGGLDWTVLQRLRGSPTGTSFDGRRWNHSLHGVPAGADEDSFYAEGPIPLTAWKFRLHNPTGQILTVRFMLHETT